MIRNQRGFVTFDFLFSLTMIFGFCAVLFALSFTLTVAEITQYITFAAARNYTAAHQTELDQNKLAVSKYQELINSPVFRPLFSNGWFNVGAAPDVGDITQIIPGYQQPAGSPNKFWGVGTAFNARILDFRIPFFGATNPDSDGTGAGFTTYLGSYLGREVSASECLNFTRERWRAIRAMDPMGAAPYSTASSETGYAVYVDDGC